MLPKNSKIPPEINEIRILFSNISLSIVLTDVPLFSIFSWIYHGITKTLPLLAALSFLMMIKAMEEIKNAKLSINLALKTYLLFIPLIIALIAKNKAAKTAKTTYLLFLGG
jgi:hypothetical protein